ncbi:secreted protein, partial [Candidatus Magnetobacterium bavaricum]
MNKISAKLLLYFLLFSLFLWGAVYLSVGISTKALESSIIDNHIDIDAKYMELITHDLTNTIDIYRRYTSDVLLGQFVDAS